MTDNALHRLHAEQDQSPWIDFIDRELHRPAASWSRWSTMASAA